MSLWCVRRHRDRSRRSERRGGPDHRAHPPRCRSRPPMRGTGPPLRRRAPSNAAFSAYPSPSSTTSRAMPRAAGVTTSNGSPASRRRISRTLPGLFVASSRRVMGKGAPCSASVAVVVSVVLGEVRLLDREGAARNHADRGRPRPRFQLEAAKFALQQEERAQTAAGRALPPRSPRSGAAPRRDSPPPPGRWSARRVGGWRRVEGHQRGRWLPARARPRARPERSVV